MLIQYEFLKILRKKSTMIVMAISLLLTAFLFGLPILQYQTYNQDGVIKGSDGIAYEKEQARNVSGLLTDAYIAETVTEYQRLFDIVWEARQSVVELLESRLTAGKAVYGYEADRQTRAVFEKYGRVEQAAGIGYDRRCELLSAAA